MKKKRSLLYGACLIATLVCFATVALNSAKAQKRNSEQDEFNQASRDLRDFVKTWNAGETVLAKDGYDFHKAIETLKDGKPDEWAIERHKLWDSLPPRLMAEVPMSKTAEMLLVSMYGENVTEFRKRVEGEAEVRKGLEMKLYLILTLAQGYAEERKSERIAPSHVFVAIAQGWTGMWPFCASEYFPLVQEQR